MSLPDPGRSRAVLIGASAFTHLDPLPAVAESLIRLHSLLTDPSVWGLPAANCRLLLNAGSPSTVLDAVEEAAAKATDTLLIYYAGHGQLDPRNRLLLALPGTRPGRSDLAVRFEDIRAHLVAARRVPSKVVVLDCCYAARAMEGSMAVGAGLVDRALVDGSSLIAAAAETESALSPPGEKYTAFTGELIGLLERGLPGAGDELTVTSLYWAMHRELAARNRPEPQIRNRNDGARIVLARNRYRRLGSLSVPAGTADPAAPEREDDEEFDALPAGIAEALTAFRKLRAIGSGDGLLERLGRWRPAQEVASALTRAGVDEVPLIREGLLARAASSIHEVYRILIEVDAAMAAADLLADLAGRRPEIVAEVAVRLAARGADRNRLLDRAVRRSTADPQRIIDLVTGLAVRDDDDGLSRVLDLTARVFSGPEARQVADALLAADRHDAAYLLFARAVDGLAGRPVADVAALAAGLIRHGHLEAALELTRQSAASRAADPAPLLLAFSAHPDLAGPQSLMEEGLAGRLARSDMLQLAGRLRAEGAEDDALRLLLGWARRAARAGSAADLAALSRGLADAGRPMDVLTVLGDVTDGMPVEALCDLVRRLSDTPRRTLARRVFGAVPDDDVTRLAELCLRLGDTEVFDVWLDHVSERPPPAVVAVVAELVRRGPLASAIGLARAASLRRSWTRDTLAPGRADLTWPLLRLAVEAPELVRPMIDNLTAPDLADVPETAAVRRRLDADFDDHVLERMWAAGTEYLAAAVLAARRTDPDCGADLADALRDRYPADLAMFEVAAEVCRAGDAHAAERLVRDRLWLPAPLMADPLIAATAEVLHAVTIRSAVKDVNQDSVLLVLRYSTSRVIFTTEAVQHSRQPSGSGLTYPEITNASAIVALNDTVSVDSGGAKQWRWPMRDKDEAFELVSLLRKVQRVGRHFARPDRPGDLVG